MCGSCDLPGRASQTGMMTFRQLQLRWQRDHPDVGAATAARPTGADELMAIFKLSPASAEKPAHPGCKTTTLEVFAEAA